MAAKRNQKLAFPSDTQRVAIIGRTGSGKTIAAMWIFANADWLEKPWYVLDFKTDSAIAELATRPEVEFRDLTDPIEDEPGIYIVRAHPDDKKDGDLETFLLALWEHEYVGLYIDEGYMVGDGRAFRALLTQGRSKHIPIIILSQRPIWMTRFVFSEADFYQVFWLNDDRDRKTIQAFLPYDLNKRLPEYSSVWYDVSTDETNVLSPVPPLPDILALFDQKLEILSKMRFEGREPVTESSQEKPSKGIVLL